MTFTQGGLHEARKMFEKSNSDKKIIVLLSDGDANYIYPSKIDVKDYYNNKKDIPDGSFYYDKAGINPNDDNVAKYCAIQEARLAEKDNINVLDIYTLAVDCDSNTKKFLEDIATDPDHAKDADTNEIEDTFKDLTKIRQRKEELRKLE